MSILIVDDSLDNRLLLESILKAGGYRDLITVESARDTFKHLGMDDPTDAVTGIDLILMDIMMPEIDGIQACLLIRANERLRDIPIIMVTANTEIENLELAFAAGAIDYINKPLNKVELLARVRSVLRLKQEIDHRREREQNLLEVTEALLKREQELKELSQKLEEANKVLQQLSSLDGLTGIANRRRFDEFLGQEWKRAIRDAKPLSLIMIDIDFFKAYNDTYGHQMGDECLKQVANVLSSRLKRPGDMVARYGGEEFVAVLSTTNIEGAVFVSEAMRSGIEELRIPHGGSKISDYVTISLGVATTFPARNSTPASLIAAADQALYQAKREGRNRVKISKE